MKAAKAIMIILMLGLLYAQSVPMLINYQAKLVDDSNDPITGTVSVTFRLYDAVEGGTQLWSEDHSSIESNNGLISVLLGSVTTFDNSVFLGSSIFLETEVSGYGILSPRQQMTSVPYAIKSGNSEPIGSIIAYGGSEAPYNWLLCNGQEVSRADYADLFSVIGTTFGEGDWSSTFNLPDLRGRMPLGLDNMGGTSANVVTAGAADTLGTTDGEEFHQLTVEETPAHAHGLKRENPEGSGSGFPYVASDTGDPTYFEEGWIGSTGGDEPHNNMPPYLSLNYIIKY